jgi:hypothetical protein
MPNRVEEAAGPVNATGQAAAVFRISNAAAEEPGPGGKTLLHERSHANKDAAEPRQPHCAPGSAMPAEVARRHGYRHHHSSACHGRSS